MMVYDYVDDDRTWYAAVGDDDTGVDDTPAADSDSDDTDSSMVVNYVHY